MHAAERYDVLVRASLAPGDYTILFEATVHGDAGTTHRGAQKSSTRTTNETLYHGHWNATLRVLAVGEGAGEHADHVATQSLPRDLPYVAIVDLSTATDMIHTSSHAMDTWPCPTVASREIPLVITARFPYVQKGVAHKIEAAPVANSPTGAWMVNNKSWVDPSAPLYLTKGKCCVTRETNYATQVVDIRKGEVVDLVVVNNGLGSTVEDHPLHLHGYKFWVVASGELPFDRRRVAYNTVSPVHADTFPLRTGYYYVLRLSADNPGFWHLHCHLLYHMFFGLQVVLNVGESWQKTPPPQYFRDLEQWPNELSGLLDAATADVASSGSSADELPPLVAAADAPEERARAVRAAARPDGAAEGATTDGAADGATTDGAAADDAPTDGEEYYEAPA